MHYQVAWNLTQPTAFQAPDESDPYFPYVAEQTGIIDIIADNSSGEQIKQEMQLNHMSVIPNESDTDIGNKADTEDDSVLISFSEYRNVPFE